MCPTYTSRLNYLIGTSIVAASRHRCSVRDADSILPGCFLQPLKLHRFFVAPCVIQTPPFLAWLVHPLKLHCLFLLHLSTMHDTNSPLNSFVVTSLNAALFMLHIICLFDPCLGKCSYLAGSMSVGAHRLCCVKVTVHCR
jgi:hypothetical protein